MTDQESTPEETRDCPEKESTSIREYLGTAKMLLDITLAVAKLTRML